jgi:multidrug resistance efflux pump
MKKLFSKIRNPKVLRVIIAVAVIIIVATSFLFYEMKKDRIAIDNSIVFTPIISVSPITPGSLMETDVYENEYVQKGDLLAIVGSEAVRAKTNGLIVMANTQTGSMANATNPVVQMIQPEDMRIAGTIDENKGLKDIKVGQVASFSVDAIPGKTYWGYVDEVSPSAKQTQISFSISSERPTQQFVVYVKYDSLKYPEVKNGMSAKLTIYTNTN